MPGFLREPSTQNCMLDQLVKRKKTGNEYLFFLFRHGTILSLEGNICRPGV